MLSRARDFEVAGSFVYRGDRMDSRISFEKDVYLVNGCARSCIYDLNTGRLYSINNALAERLCQICEKGLFDEKEDVQLTEVINQLISLKILSKTGGIINSSIENLKRSDTKINMVWVEITSKCNMKCIHCYNESNPHTTEEMSLEDFKLVIDCIEKLSVPKLQIIGGEPFVNKKLLKEMLLYAIGKFTTIEVFTNGTLITDEWFEFLRENQINIALSVYSYISEKHDCVTGCAGSWEKTNLTIKKLHENNIKYRVCNILMKDIPLGERNTQLYELSAEKDIVRMTGRANFHLLTDELIEKKLITKETFATPVTKSFVQRLVSGHNCYGSKLYISSKLEVFPCVMERRIKHCSISKDGQIHLNKDILNLDKNKIKECQECEYRYACFDCRPNSLSGNLDEKPWYCTYNPKTGKWADKAEFIRELRRKWE